MIDKRTYDELIKLPTFRERFNYLKLHSSIGVKTFGFDRWLNQRFYTSREWINIRHTIILRDNACDLGIVGMEIIGRIYIHHINPLTVDDIKHADRSLFDTQNLICCSQKTHNAIHFGNEPDYNYTERKKGDTILW